jgi:hypothetical protein
MLLGPVLQHPPSLITFDTGTVERVTSFKLLGITISNNFNWDEHVSEISANNKRLHFLKLLKRSSVTRDDLLLYYKTVIRPVIEYASCPVWHQSALTVEQRNRLETIQRRALYLISGSSDYEMQCVLCDIEPISVRLDNLARSFFYCICNPDDCLHYLLPSERPAETTCKLRQANKLPGITCRTNRFFKTRFYHML